MRRYQQNQPEHTTAVVDTSTAAIQFPVLFAANTEQAESRTRIDRTIRANHVKNRKFEKKKKSLPRLAITCIHCQTKSAEDGIPPEVISQSEPRTEHLRQKQHRTSGCQKKGTVETNQERIVRDITKSSGAETGESSTSSASSSSSSFPSSSQPSLWPRTSEQRTVRRGRGRTRSEE